MKITWYIPFIAALVPMVVGFVWYNPKVFGTAWMKAADMNPEKAGGANMGLVFGLAYVLSLLVAVALAFSTIHQFHIFSILAGQPDFKTPGSETQNWIADFLARHGNNFRTFKHGVFHGALVGILVGVPIMGTNALFERKGFKYVAINGGYWIVAMALMGGVVCAWL